MDTIFTVPISTASNVGDRFPGIKLVEKNWVGTHTFNIKSTTGTVAATSYPLNTQDSSNFSIQVVNPCETATFTIPNLAKSTTLTPIGKVIEAREMGGQVTYQYEMPTDSASVAYGSLHGINNYDLCGTRRHYLSLEDGNGASSIYFGY